ncbi:MAG: hypothetical protein AABX37_04910 [Nanoarchaeota archaeon]
MDNWKTGKVDPEAYKKWVINAAQEYPLPAEYQAYKAGEVEPVRNELWGLNYLLLDEIFKLSPTGRVTELVHHLATGRVSQSIGMARLRQLREQNLLICQNNPREIRYVSIMIGSDLRKEEFYVEQLPVWERLIEKTPDASTVGDAIIHTHTRTIPGPSYEWGPDKKPVSIWYSFQGAETGK